MAIPHKDSGKVPAEAVEKMRITAGEVLARCSDLCYKIREFRHNAIRDQAKFLGNLMVDNLILATNPVFIVKDGTNDLKSN